MNRIFYNRQILKREGLESRSPGPTLFKVLSLVLIFVIMGCTDGVSRDDADSSVVESPTTLEDRFHEKNGASPAPEILDAKVIRSLRKDFKKKLSRERTEMLSTLKSKYRSSVAERKQKFHDWNQNEKTERHRFFSRDDVKSSERKTYVEDFIARRKVLLSEQKSEDQLDKRKQDEEQQSFEKEQETRLKEFENYLSRRMRPAEQLWNP